MLLGGGEGGALLLRKGEGGGSQRGEEGCVHCFREGGRGVHGQAAAGLEPTHHTS